MSQSGGPSGLPPRPDTPPFHRRTVRYSRPAAYSRYENDSWTPRYDDRREDHYRRPPRSYDYRRSPSPPRRYSPPPLRRRSPPPRSPPRFYGRSSRRSRSPPPRYSRDRSPRRDSWSYQRPRSRSPPPRRRTRSPPDRPSPIRAESMRSYRDFSPRPRSRRGSSLRGRSSERMDHRDRSPNEPLEEGMIDENPPTFPEPKQEPDATPPPVVLERPPTPSPASAAPEAPPWESPRVQRVPETTPSHSGDSRPATPIIPHPPRQPRNSGGPPSYPRASRGRATPVLTAVNRLPPSGPRSSLTRTEGPAPTPPRTSFPLPSAPRGPRNSFADSPATPSTPTSYASLRPLPEPVIPALSEADALRLNSLLEKDSFDNIDHSARTRRLLRLERKGLIKSLRRARHELDLVRLDLRAAEMKTKVTHSQLDRAKVGELGIDYGTPIPVMDFY